MKDKDFIIEGELYEYLSEEIITLKKGQRIQVTDYKVTQEDGKIRYPYMICVVPSNYDRIELSKLSDSCLKKFAEGIVEFSENELQNQ